jgi:hypothetical protein
MFLRKSSQRSPQAKPQRSKWWTCWRVSASSAVQNGMLLDGEKCENWRTIYGIMWNTAIFHIFFSHFFAEILINLSHSKTWTKLWHLQQRQLIGFTPWIRFAPGNQRVTSCQSSPVPPRRTTLKVSWLESQPSWRCRTLWITLEHVFNKAWNKYLLKQSQQTISGKTTHCHVSLDFGTFH